MLEFHEVSVDVRDGRRRRRIVDRVSLSLPAGTTLGLVGESGAGKSTVGRAACGLARAATGSVLLSGQPYDIRSGRIQMVFQNPLGSFNPRRTIGAQLLDAVKARARTGTRAARADAVASALHDVGMGSEAMGSYPHQFSGGQRQRLAIARALLVEPEVIVADEPTSALDVSIQATVLNLLSDLQAQFGFALLFISHDLAVVSYMCDTVGVMQGGALVECAPTDQLFVAPTHPYSRVLLGAAAGHEPGGR